MRSRTHSGTPASSSFKPARIQLRRKENPMTATAEETRISPAETPVLVAVRGIADLSDGRGYLRTAGYRRSPGDIPLTPAQVRQHGLRQGDQVEGTAAPQALAGGSRNR